jgi:hypothetical protein
MKLVLRSAALGGLVALVTACAPAVRPIESTDLVGGGPSAGRVTVRVKAVIEVPAPFSVVYVLPVGEYRPAYADGHGSYFESPTGIVERADGSERTLVGGLHLPNAGGEYYSFPSLYVESSPRNPSKLPLPSNQLKSYGENVVFIVDGVEQSE